LKNLLLFPFFVPLIFVIYSKTYSGENNIIGEKNKCVGG